MPTEHSTITDPEIHEPKGVASASSGQVYAANGAGSGSWTTLNIPTITSARASGYIETSALNTAFSAANTPVKVNVGTAFTSDVTTNFTVSTGGRFTYTGTPSVDVFLVAKVNAEQTSTTTKNYNFYIAKNDTIIASSVTHAEYDGVNPSFIAVSGLTTLATSDYLEVWVECVTDTTSLNVITMSVEVFN